MSDKINPNDPRLTAYALGEMQGSERAAFETLLKKDPDAQNAIKEIKMTESLLADQFVREEKPKLTSEQRQKVMLHVVQPKPKNVISFPSSRRVIRNFSLTALAACLVLGLGWKFYFLQNYQNNRPSSEIVETPSAAPTEMKATEQQKQDDSAPVVNGNLTLKETPMKGPESQTADDIRGDHGASVDQNQAAQLPRPEGMFDLQTKDSKKSKQADKPAATVAAREEEQSKVNSAKNEKLFDAPAPAAAAPARYLASKDQVSEKPDKIKNESAAKTASNDSLSRSKAQTGVGALKKESRTITAASDSTPAANGLLGRLQAQESEYAVITAPIVELPLSQASDPALKTIQSMLGQENAETRLIEWFNRASPAGSIYVLYGLKRLNSPEYQRYAEKLNSAAHEITVRKDGRISNVATEALLKEIETSAASASNP